MTHIEPTTNVNRVCLIVNSTNVGDRSYLINKITRYMRWISINCEVFKDDLCTLARWFENNGENGSVAILESEFITIHNFPLFSQLVKDYQLSPLFLDYRSGTFENNDRHMLEQTVSFMNDIPYIKLSNDNEKVLINRIKNYLHTRILGYVLNIKMRRRSIWLSRHGESIYNVERKIGGNSALSPRGVRYSQVLPSLLKDHTSENSKFTVWTSTLKRTIETAQYLPYEKQQFKGLDELDAGVCDGLTYTEIAEKYPSDFRSRDNDKFSYKYRGGESYKDVISRIEPIIMELERQDDILIITHQAVLRCIYAYFMNIPKEQSPWMTIPLHTLIRLTPTTDGIEVTKIETHIPAVSTFKEKGSLDVVD